MKTLLLLLIILFAANLSLLAADAERDTRCYEMRTYYPAPGKMADLHKRFRNYTNRLFTKHGMTLVGYWVPKDNPNEKLIYILAYPSREARAQSWKAFIADPEWKAAHKESELNGKLVAKGEAVFMQATDYSPTIKPSAISEPRVFELRTYKTEPGRLEALHARFRDHTMKLFTKHGMTHIGYWTPMAGEKGASDTLIYILAHKSSEAAADSFKAFRNDPDWVAARKASEDKAGGSLTVKDGVQSLFMVPTDYSPIK